MVLLENIKTLYKRTMPPLLDKSGYYDYVIASKKSQYLVPLYHRVVSNSNEDPFKLGMCVSVDAFENQIEYLSNNYTSISLMDYCNNKEYIKQIVFYFCIRLLIKPHYEY